MWGSQPAAPPPASAQSGKACSGEGLAGSPGPESTQCATEMNYKKRSNKNKSKEKGRSKVGC